MQKEPNDEDKKSFLVALLLVLALVVSAVAQARTNESSTWRRHTEARAARSRLRPGAPPV